MLLETNDLIRFERYVVDRSGWTLKWEQEPIALNRKSFDLLIYLIDHRDRVCSKDELLAGLWPDQFIEESNLSQQIFLLRKALSRHQSGRRIIETIPGRGYRFVAPLEIEPPGGALERLQQQIVVKSSESISVTRITVEEEESEAEGEQPAALPPSDQGGSRLVEAPASSLRRRATDVPGYVDANRPLAHTTRSAPLRWLLFGVAALVFAAVYLGLRWNDPAHLRISAYTQITTDGRAKTIGGTDGSRIYFTRRQPEEISEVSVSGGLEAPLQLGIGEARSGDVSPDGSTLLIVSQAGGQGPANSLWSFRLVGGALRHLADAVVSAAWSPDGERIVYASANGDVFVMRRDGSEAHRIASVGGYLMSLAWSPNGNTIRFSKEGLLWEIAHDGTNLRQLLPGWGLSPTQWSGEWAPDGRYFFVADGQIWFLPHGRVIGSSLPARPSRGWRPSPMPSDTSELVLSRRSESASGLRMPWAGPLGLDIAVEGFDDRAEETTEGD